MNSKARHLTFRDNDYSKYDPHNNYIEGVIVNPDETWGDFLGRYRRRASGGRALVRIGDRWANCHAPNGINLHAYGIRWWLSPSDYPAV